MCPPRLFHNSAWFCYHFKAVDNRPYKSKSLKRGTFWRIFITRQLSVNSIWPKFLTSQWITWLAMYRGMGILGTHGATWDSAQYFGYATLVITDSNLFQWNCSITLFTPCLEIQDHLKEWICVQYPPGPAWIRGDDFKLLKCSEASFPQGEV